MVVFYLRGRTERVDGAGVAELADARDSKSRFLLGSVGSTPSSGTTYSHSDDASARPLRLPCQRPRHLCVVLLL